MVLAEPRGGGALASRDGGATWAAAEGLECRYVRAFAFALTLVAAGTDHGVYVSTDGLSWTPSGLSDRSIDALAVEAIHAPVRLIAGSDLQGAGGGLPLFQSLDAGVALTPLRPPINGPITGGPGGGPPPPTRKVP